MTLSGPVVYLPSVHSTQDEIKKTLTGLVWTTDQTAGRGRFDRKWHSEAGKGLAVSIAFPEYRGFARPYLISMWICLGLAEEFGLRIQWPNDLVLNRKKVSGVLTEVVDEVPVVGIGINVGPMTFPEELSLRATSFANEGHLLASIDEVFSRFLSVLERLPAVPSTWAGVEPTWQRFDDTEGKVFRLHDGRVGIARGISSEGELIWSGDGGEQRVPFAEALWGVSAS
ncbi:MAG: biotin--[acetyl-CoA-carboxylase] ligase [Armatimonadetes bacterium]|nr:biotin--[acetyl-CoA-carboxylase] ligase [Armatimonadota bacterium]